MLAALVPTLALTGCDGGRGQQSAAFEVTARLPHDPTAYTQGLLWADSVLYESTGEYGHSDVRRVDLRSGRVLASRPLPANRFGEGLALLKGRLYQLTWESGVAYTYDAATLAPVDSFQYPGEGWGLATDGTSLIMSDGSDSLRILSPETFRVQRVVHVRYQGAPLYKLNELEYADGDVLANVYESKLGAPDRSSHGRCTGSARFRRSLSESAGVGGGHERRRDRARWQAAAADRQALAGPVSGPPSPNPTEGRWVAKHRSNRTDRCTVTRRAPCRS